MSLKKYDSPPCIDFRRPSIQLLLVLGVVLCLCNVTGCSSSQRSSDKYIGEILRQYVRDGLTVEIFGEETERLTVSGDSLTYSAGTLDDIFHQIRQKRQSPGFESSRSLTASQYLNEIIGRLAVGTHYEDRFRINQDPDLETLNIYFLKEDPANLVDEFEQNCAFIGWMNAIICDANFVKDRLNEVISWERYYSITLLDSETETGEIGTTDPEVKKILDNLMQGCFITWFLGHEIGHAVLHANYVRGSGRNVHFNDPEYDGREREADDFVADRLIDPSRLSSTFLVMLGEFIEQEYRRMYDVLKPQGKTEEVGLNSDRFPIRYALEVEYSQFNMPILVRAVQIADRLTQRAPSLDSTGHYKKVLQNINLTRSPIDAATEWGRVGLLLGVLVLVSGLVYFMASRKRKV